MTGIVLACCLAKADKAYLGVCVEDAVSHVPLQGVKVTANFEDDIGWRAWTDSANPDIAEGFTDKHGFCRLSGKTNCGRSSIWVDKAPKGYYEAAYGGGTKYTRKSLLGTWQPEDVVVTVALQRVEHPIPLYVHRVILDGRRESVGGFDGTNAVVRFDFIADDWLPPEGHGKHADMVIRTSYALRDKVKDGKYYTQIFYDFTNMIEFLGEGNGYAEETIAGRNCGIRIRVAPETGYVFRKTLRFGRRRKKTEVKGVWPDEYTDSNDDRCYSFRIRSRFDEKGNLVEAYYGKIYGDFRFRGTDKGFHGANFLYYLNPTSLDRNLEWDRKNNLCKKPLRMDYEPIGVRYREP
jgi:hypothetical protein